MPFVKGQSGNPNGGPTRLQLREAKQFAKWCQLAAKKYGWKILGKFLTDNDKEYRLKALEIILDRGFGKPVQTNYNENTISSDLDNLTDAQLKERLKQSVEKELNIVIPRDPSNIGQTGIPPVQ